jgi:hypothetical protein
MILTSINSKFIRRGELLCGWCKLSVFMYKLQKKKGSKYFSVVRRCPSSSSKCVPLKRVKCFSSVARTLVYYSLILFQSPDACVCVCYLTTRLSLLSHCSVADRFIIEYEAFILF